MLLSKHIKLMATFDHRHVFIDPNPDRRPPGRSGRGCSPCRIRLGELRRRDLRGSACAGRRSRSRHASACNWALRAASGTMTPRGSINACLKRRRDLLWNGIGTYVKAGSGGTPRSATRRAWAADQRPGAGRGAWGRRNLSPTQQPDQYAPGVARMTPTSSTTQPESTWITR
jgi:glutamate dehydrogenase